MEDLTTRLESFPSWGRTSPGLHAVERLYWRHQLPSFRRTSGTLLARGQGRSYGDVCLNPSGTLWVTEGLDRLMSLDRQTGLLRCEAGVTLEQISRVTVPLGWFLPVTPGTKYVSIGGAIANDVHGKNHHRAGTFARHVRQLELLRSDGEKRVCSPAQNTDLFFATLGGLGLTGLITWAEIQMKPISTPWMKTQAIAFTSLDEFLALSQQSDATHEYTVAWVDCLARGSSLGRGVFFRGNHAEASSDLLVTPPEPSAISVPFDAPACVMNGWTMKLFNTLYYTSQTRHKAERLESFEPFFYPLDAVRDWNRLYGKQGFFQFQCVVPMKQALEAISTLLDMTAASGTGSFLAVLKQFGTLTSPAMLSFPRPGLTLTLDFPNRGEKTRKRLGDLDAVVRRYGGAVYPAKDACMSAESFQAYFPAWESFSRFVDPRFSSSFWRRVTGIKENSAG